MRDKRRFLQLAGAAAVASLPFPVLLYCMTEALGAYGITLFVVLPCSQGFLAAFLLTRIRPTRLADQVLAANLSLVFSALWATMWLLEGLICIIMAAPLEVLLATLGALIHYVLHIMLGGRTDHPIRVLSLLLLSLFTLAFAESRILPEPPVFKVVTALEVEAPPERVWEEVIAFSRMPEPQEWLFRLGIAYPIRAELRGRGVGAIRHCVFSTGSFVEPIEVWDAPRLLKFRVDSNPPPMRELTLYGEAHPPHLEGFLESTGGQFRLHRLAGNRTRLEGTTWYRHSMWPASYWQLWSDHIIHKIHLRVLRHIRDAAEKTPRDC